jgi:hypothetical protein
MRAPSPLSGRRRIRLEPSRVPSDPARAWSLPRFRDFPSSNVAGSDRSILQRPTTWAARRTLGETTLLLNQVFLDLEARAWDRVPLWSRHR